MATFGGPHITTEGLILFVDVANSKSFVSGSGTWYDLSGNNIDGAVSGSVYASDNFGVLNFDGNDDYIEFSNPPDPQTDTGNWTVETWVYPVSGSGVCCWVEWDGGAHIWQYSDEVDFFCNPRGSASQHTVGNSILLDEWGYYSVVFDGDDNQMRFYINAELVGEFTESGSSDTNSSILRIGRRVSDNRVFSGSFSFCSIYETPLTQKQIQRNFDAIKGRYNL